MTKYVDQNARSQFINKADDCIWLRETHLKPANMDGPFADHTKIKSFIIFGNEDCPNKIVIYNVESPTLQDKPIARYALTEDLKYKLET